MPIKTQISYKKTRYLTFVDFNAKDAEYLKKNFRFHKLDLDDCQSEQERPKIDEYDKYLFIVLQVPFYNNRKQTIETSEVNIFIGQNYLVLAHDDEIEWIKALRKKLTTMKSKKRYMGNGTGYFLYEIVEGIFSSTFKVLDKLQREIRSLEKEVFETREQRDWLEDILHLKKSIITFRRTILPQRSVISQLEHKNKKFLNENLEVYFDNVVDEIEKIWQQLEIMKETVDTLESTNESLLAHYTNNIMKILTIISVILLPLTFITGLYGMNIGLPLENNPEAFWMIIFGMGGLAVLMLIIFRWKRWL